jgi:manganese-dependent inorganic pyrophosphatase
MTTLVFGHKSPDTDSTGSPIIWAWYLSEIAGEPAAPVLLGEPNTEAAFMLARWGLDKPAIIDGVEADQPVVIVDTNNPAELPENVNAADIRRSSTTTSWSAGWRPRAPSTSGSSPWPARRRSCTR